MTNEERARRWIDDRDLGRATVESDVASLVMQFDKVRELACKRDPRAHFMGWGTAGSDVRFKTPLGKVCLRRAAQSQTQRRFGGRF